MSSQPSVIALIPARSGSKRIQGKNVKPLRGHPLLAYTIAAARESGVFARVIVSTESEDTAEIARHYGAEVPFLRPPAYAGDLSPDIEWVRDVLHRLAAAGLSYDCFSLLRRPAPFVRPIPFGGPGPGSSPTRRCTPSEPWNAASSTPGKCG
jgi:N-acylneuraminate cytidylyltransferase